MIAGSGERSGESRAGRNIFPESEWSKGESEERDKTRPDGTGALVNEKRLGFAAAQTDCREHGVDWGAADGQSGRIVRKI